MIQLKALFGLLYLASILKSYRLNLKELWDLKGCISFISLKLIPFYFSFIVTIISHYLLENF